MKWLWGVVVMWGLVGDARADVGEQCAADRARGSKLRAEHELRGAMYAFRACSAPECSDAVRDECASAYDAVMATMPSIVVVVRDARGEAMTRAHVVVDGREQAPIHGAFVVDPGGHRVRVDGIDGVEQHVTVGDSDHKRIVFASPAVESRPLWRSAAWPWLVTSAGATGVIIGSVMTGVSYATFQKDCLGGTTLVCSQFETLHSVNQAGIGVIVGGAIVTAAGVVWLALHPHRPSTLAFMGGNALVF